MWEGGPPFLIDSDSGPRDVGRYSTFQERPRRDINCRMSPRQSDGAHDLVEAPRAVHGVVQHDPRSKREEL